MDKPFKQQPVSSYCFVVSVYNCSAWDTYKYKIHPRRRMKKQAWF